MKNYKIETFIKSVLGETGLSVVDNLIKKYPQLESYIIPRTIISWLRTNDEFKNLDNTPFVVLNKSENEYSGCVVLKSENFDFKKVSEQYIAAIVTTECGFDLCKTKIKNIDLARLGKTIDLLSKAQNEVNFEHNQRAKNLQFDEPILPEQTPKIKEKKTFRIPRINKQIKLNKNELDNICFICKEKLISHGNFLGCTCFKPMAKSICLIQKNNDLFLDLDKSLSDDVFLALVKVFKYGK